MDTASAKRFNAKAGYRPDPAIAFFDALAENTEVTKIMKLPKVPNTKGKYLAQYLDTSGTVSVYKWNGSKDHFVVYRILPEGIIKYYVAVDTTNFKNDNSRNHYLVGTLGQMYKTILAYRKNLKYSDKTFVQLLGFKLNLDRLIEKKKDTTLLLRQVASVITGKTVVGFEFETNDDLALVKANRILGQLQSIIGDMDYQNLINYKK